MVNFPRSESIVDLAEMGFVNWEYCHPFLCIDTFSKYAYGTEMPNENSNSTAIVLGYVLSKMGIPKANASDDGGECKGRFKHILDGEGIVHIVMTTHVSFIDRFTRTIKHMLFGSVQHTCKKWQLLLPNVIKQYKIQFLIQPNLNLLMLLKTAMHHM